MDEGPGRKSQMADAASGLSLAFEFAGAVFLFWFLGRLIDNWLGIDPWAQVIGSLIGWAGGFAHVYYRTQQDVGKPTRQDRGKPTRQDVGKGRGAGA